MTGVSQLLRDLEVAMGRGTAEDRAVTLARLTDLLLSTAGGLNDDQIGVFDVVIGRLATAIEARARIDLSERLADLPNAPHGVIRQLALDEIPVARPVLTRSRRLTDDDLVTIAATKGRDHMLAMTERRGLSEPVTDYLVLKGDRVIQHAVVSNQSARFSQRGMNLLVSRALKDHALQSALGSRGDVPPELAERLIEAAKATAQERLGANLAPADQAVVASAIARSAADRATTDMLHSEVGRFGEALIAVKALHDAGKLDETVVQTYAANRKIDEVVCALALLAQLPLAGAEKSLLGSDKDSSLILAKALGWTWQTAKLLLALRSEDEQMPHLVEKSRVAFDTLSAATAQRVLRFVQVREQAQQTA
jgi:uncharacterized protein (DUF2336 family)